MNQPPRYTYQAFGSPMLGSTITTAPRRQGDGMDSESLRQQTPPGGGSGKQYGTVTTFGKQTGYTSDTMRQAASLNEDHIKLAPTNTNIQRPGEMSRPSVTQKLPPSPIPIEVQLDTSLDTLADREVEGIVSSGLNSSNQVESLLKTVDELKTQLNNQNKVNTDLKKLLVASMGDDLHYKVDSLVRTRAQLADKIGGYTDKIVQDHESLDKLTIQADMWRSKYTASRVLIDELAGTKEYYERHYTDARLAITQLLQDRTQLAEAMRDTYRYLKVIKDSFDPRGALSGATIPNILELARTNHLLADSIKFRLLPAMPVFPAAIDGAIQDGGTPGEKLALQARGVLSKITDPEALGSVPGRLQANLIGKFDRFHPHVRYDNITFNCCCKCKGDIQVV